MLERHGQYMTAVLGKLQRPMGTLLGQDETWICGTQYLRAANANCIANNVLAPHTQLISVFQL